MNVGMFIIALGIAFCGNFGIAYDLRRRLRDMNIESHIEFSMMIPLSLIGGGALYGIWHGFTMGYSFGAILTAFVLTLFRGLGISLGLHRHDTHKSFKAHPLFQFFLALCHWTGGMRKKTWVPDHEQHHRYEDTIRDPHSPWAPFNGGWRGWLWSDAGWLLVKRDLHVPTREDISFLRAESCLFPLCFALGFAIPYYFFGLEGLLLCGFMSVAYVFKTAFGVNSSGHMFGRAVNQKSKSRNTSWFFALITMVGEKYHANHHADQGCAFLGWRWYDVDAGKWLLLGLEKLGIVYDVKRPRKYIISRAS